RIDGRAVNMCDSFLRSETIHVYQVSDSRIEIPITLAEYLVRKVEHLFKHSVYLYKTITLVYPGNIRIFPVGAHRAVYSFKNGIQIILYWKFFFREIFYLKGSSQRFA